MNSLNAPLAKPSDSEAIEALGWSRLAIVIRNPYPEFTVASAQPAPEPKSTPLLDALKAEKTAAKDKEAILRNHPHYFHQQETPTIVVAPTKKEDSKKKGAMKIDEPSVPPPTKKSGRAKKSEASKSNLPQTVPTIIAAPPAPANKTPNQTALPAKPPLPAHPKAPRQPRDAPQNRRAQPVADTTTTSPPSTSTPAPSTQPSAEQPSAPATPTAPRERRTRPLMGLQSRQFSAALNGAGVVLSSDGGRAGRREREKKAEAPGHSPSASTDISSGAGADGKESHDKRKDRQTASVGLAPGGSPTVSSTIAHPDPSQCQFKRSLIPDEFSMTIQIIQLPGLRRQNF